MKITPEHYAEMKAKLLQLKDKITPHREYLVREGRSKDIEKRLRWDLCHAAIGSKWVCDTLYPYANDDHIDTALRHIMAEIN